MKRLSLDPLTCFVPLLVTAMIGWWSGTGWAADAAAGADPTALSRLLAYVKANYTRSTWDYAMRWINFAILAGLIIKYARVPFAHFLKDKKAETARSLQRFESQKQAAKEQIRDGRLRLEASKERLDLIQERIVAEGKKRKEIMILEAREESRLMLASARARIDHHIQEVARTIKIELIDAAYDKAVERLPQMVTEADHQRLLNQWLDEAAK